MLSTATAVIIIAVVVTDPPAQRRERFEKTPDITLGEAGGLAASISLIDVDGDGDLDVLLANGRHWPAINTLVINNRDTSVQHRLPARGTSHTFSVSIPLGRAANTSYAIAGADFDKDGLIEFVVANDRGPNSLYEMTGPEDIGFVGYVSKRADMSRDVRVGDLTGDTYLDIILANVNERNRICFGDGGGRFERSVVFGTVEDNTFSVQVGDIDGDGDLDIVVGNVGMQNAVYYNERNGGSFREERFGFDDAMTYWVALGDVDGDGRLDIAIANSGGQSGVYLNRIAKGK